jgi:hypothetical protein
MPRCIACGRITKKIPDYLPIGNGYNHYYLLSSEYERVEPDESSDLRLLLWEGRGEIPLPDPIISHFRTTENKRFDLNIL